MLVENIAYACVTKWCEKGNGNKDIIHWINSDLSEIDYSYSHFEDESNKIANVLQYLGTQAGDVVSIFLPRSPLLISSVFGILKLQALSCILFSTLGEEALLDRLGNSEAKIVITKNSLVRKIIAIKNKLPNLKDILVIDADEHKDDFVLSLPKLMQEADNTFDYPHQVDSETPAFLQYTSGSTGKPKGALHVHGAILDIIRSFNEILQVEQEDIYWCTADPAWITGLSYGVFAPMATLSTQIQYGGAYNADHWLEILKEKAISVWYTAPTALRMLMQEEPGKFDIIRSNSLKRIYSVGEPLNPEIYHWGKKVFGKEVYDNWFQSETGSIMISNRPGLEVKPGSMGKPRTGIEPLILNDEKQPVAVGEQGHLTVRKGWDSMFRNYYKKDEAYQEKFWGDFYVTGDLAYKDEDGNFWYVSRSDDVINTAGHLVGPFEVESALLEIEEIGDAAVIGVDDAILHKKIIAFVVPKNNFTWDKHLELKSRIYISNKVSTVAIPAEFIPIEKVPKNQSGKILRRVLRALYEKKDPGDLSTME
jgi:acetyl-CoA synthetase